MKSNGRVQVDLVCRANQIVLAEISPVGEEGVEGLEIWSVRIPVTAGDIRLQTKAGVKRQRVEGVTGIGCNHPCLDISIAEPSPLVDKFEVVVDGFCSPPQPGSRRVADFAGSPLVKAHFPVMIPDIIQVDVRFKGSR